MAKKSEQENNPAGYKAKYAGQLLLSNAAFAFAGYAAGGGNIEAAIGAAAGAVLLFALQRKHWPLYETMCVVSGAFSVAAGYVNGTDTFEPGVRLGAPLVAGLLTLATMASTIQDEPPHNNSGL